MDRKDLRIGDRVTYKDVILTISEISELYVLSTKYGYSRTFSIQYLEQIQITENLLNYVGFKDFQFNSNNGWIGVELFGDGDWWFTLRDSEGQYLAEIKVNYLHQLQHIMWDFLHQEV